MLSASMRAIAPSTVSGVGCTYFWELVTPAGPHRLQALPTVSRKCAAENESPTAGMVALYRHNFNASFHRRWPPFEPVFECFTLDTPSQNRYSIHRPQSSSHRIRRHQPFFCGSDTNRASEMHTR